MAAHGLFTVVAFFAFAACLVQGYITCYDDTTLNYYTCGDFESCCGFDSCCDDNLGFWSVWYFWIIVIFMIAIVSSCVGCCIRAARNRRARQYYRIRGAQPPVYGTVVVSPSAAPAYPAAAHPAYSAATSAYPAAAPAYTNAPPPKYQDGVY